jgi:hypothetical protein
MGCIVAQREFVSIVASVKAAPKVKLNFTASSLATVQYCSDVWVVWGWDWPWLLAIDHSFHRRCSEIALFNALMCLFEHNNSAVLVKRSKNAFVAVLEMHPLTQL